MTRHLKAALLAAALSGICASTAYAGWNQSERGYWYQYDDGSFAKSGIKNIEGTDYAFDSEGYMLTGWQYLSFKWYYFDTVTGVQAKGWTQLDGNWYYFDPADFGAMYTYWLDIGKDRYYLDESGVLKTGVFYLSDSTNGSKFAYEADASGVLIRNTTKKNGNKTIKYDENGIMMYRNETTKKVGSATGDGAWQYVLNEEDMSGQKDENQEIIAKETARLKSELYSNYLDKVAGAKASRKEQEKNNWKNRVRRKLGDFMSESEIEAYIASVESGVGYGYSSWDYDDEDDGDYEFDYWEDYDYGTGE